MKKNIELVKVGVKKIIEPHGFCQVGALEWVRKNNNIFQIIYFEKMKSDNIRLRVFVLSENDNSLNLGGNTTTAMIQGGGVIGGDYYWSIDTQNNTLESLANITEVIKSVVFVFFSAVSDEKILKSVLINYPNSNIYKLFKEDYIKVSCKENSINYKNESASLHLESCEIVSDILLKTLINKLSNFNFK